MGRVRSAAPAPARSLRFLIIIRLGSMAKAAQSSEFRSPPYPKLSPTLSMGLGVRLLDRGPQGVSPTVYGVALEGAASRHSTR